MIQTDHHSKNTANTAIPKVSIIVSVYNTEQYLSRCLDSICQQTEKNIEIIVVDDASSDNSWQLIQHYVKQDIRIVPLQHKKNKRPGGARNSGIRRARGEWLTFVDSDDYIHPDMIKTCLQKITEYPAVELLVCGATRVLSDNRHVNFCDLGAEEALIENPFRHHCQALQPDLSHIAWSKLWKRETFSCKKLFFPENMSTEDFALIPQLLYELSGPALIIPQRLYYYRYRADSLSNVNNETQTKDFSRALHILVDWAEQAPIAERTLMMKLITHVFYIRIAKTSFHTPPFLNTLLESVPQKLLRQTIQNIVTDPWFRFGQRSFRGKVLVIAEAVSKKLGLYRLLKATLQFFKLRSY